MSAPTNNTLDPAVLRDIIQNGGVPFKQNGISYRFDCPRCKKSDKVWAYKKTGYFKCYVCSEEAVPFKGRIEKLLVELYGGSFQQYSKMLRGAESLMQDNLELEFVDHWGEFPEDREDFQIVDWVWPPQSVAWNDPLFEDGARYLVSRGITLSIIKKYDIRYDVRTNRVQFPFKVDGQLVGWQGRLCGPTTTLDGRKLLKAHTTLQEGVATQFVMFGDNLGRSAHAVLAEGPVDALKAELCGGNVASLGKGVTERQIKYIADRCKRLYLALDDDAASNMMRLSEMCLDYSIQPMLMRVPEDREDFGACTYLEVVQAFNNATIMHTGKLMLFFNNKLHV